MAGGWRRILVIEDDRETTGQIVEALVTSSYAVDLTADGEDGLNRARSPEYAVMRLIACFRASMELASSGA
jgi:two-component system, OmpR family, response regulator